MPELRCYWCGHDSRKGEPPIDSLTLPGIYQRGSKPRLAHEACAEAHGWRVQQQWWRDGASSATVGRQARTLLAAIRPFLQDPSGTRWRIADRLYGPTTIVLTLEPYVSHRGRRIRLRFLGERTLVLYRAGS